MEYYVGLDVSLKQTSICVVDQTGSVVREGVVDSDPEAISVYVRSKAPGAVRIGLETGPTSTWLWTELKRLGLPVICIDARHAKAVLKMPSYEPRSRHRPCQVQCLRCASRGVEPWAGRLMMDITKHHASSRTRSFVTA